MQWSERPPAARSHFACLVGTHFEPRAVSVAVARFILVRPMNLYARGIASHVAAWFVCCAIWPLIVYGVQFSTIVRFGWLPFAMFLIGIVPLLMGSVLWM